MKKTISLSTAFITVLGAIPFVFAGLSIDENKAPTVNLTLKNSVGQACLRSDSDRFLSFVTCSGLDNEIPSLMLLESEQLKVKENCISLEEDALVLKSCDPFLPATQKFFLDEKGKLEQEGRCVEVSASGFLSLGDCKTNIPLVEKTEEILKNDAGQEKEESSSINGDLAFKKPIIIEYYNGGAYSAWLKVAWVKDNNDNVRETGYISAGQYVKIEVPLGAKSVRVVTTLSTGIIWNKYNVIRSLDLSPSHSNVYEFGERFYFGTKSWGTTFHPGAAEYKPEMNINGRDPYSKDPNECTEMVRSTYNYVGLVTTKYQFRLINNCANNVQFNLFPDGGAYDVRGFSKGYVDTNINYKKFAVRFFN